MKMAIMQPYFIPYAGYFRLFSATDLFVVYDCVQFPRRGWVHRNQLATAQKTLEWVTLPLQKQPVDIAIRDLLFREQAAMEWQDKLKTFSAVHVIEKKFPTLFALLTDLNQKPVDMIVGLLREICAIIAIPCNIAYSSELKLSADLKGQDRILTIVQHFQGTHYINAPGGRELYQAEAFASRGIQLDFLPSYDGEFCSVLQRLAEQTPQQLQKHIQEFSL